MKRKTIMFFLMTVCVAMSGCGASGANTANNGDAGNSAGSAYTEGENSESGSISGTSGTSSDISGLIDTTDIFTDRDLAQTADTIGAKSISVTNGETIDITDEGVYVLSGTAENCTVRVEAEDTDKVQLVLDGVTISNESSPAIYVVQADKCFVTTKDNNSALSVTGTFMADGDTNTDAVIFSKQDLVLNGEGTLDIYSTGNAVSVKDDLKITGGSYIVRSDKHAFEVNDSVSVCGGDFKITSSKDGFNCGNDNDETLGWTYISGGTFNIVSSSDGIRTASLLQIDGGNIDITSSEGLEATYIQINDGKININSNDDGINATDKCNGYYKIAVEFNGGETNIIMGSGDVDGIDSNGSVYVNDGTINITIDEVGMAEAFDFDETAELNGGEVYVNGERITEITTNMPGGRRGNMGKGF